MTRKQTIERLKALSTRYIGIFGGNGHRKGYFEGLNVEDLERKLQTAEYMEREVAAYERLKVELGSHLLACVTGSATPNQLDKFEKLQHHSKMASHFWHQI